MALVGSELTAVGSVLTAAGEDSPGVGPPVVVPTLAQVYAAGAGAPITDDLMAMLHGNMRFQSPVDSNPLPLLGYWENATGQATSASGFPAELWSLSVILGTDNGRRFALYQMFDPAWDGSFLEINGMSWQTERVTFTNDPTNEYRNQNLNPAFGARDWKTFYHFASVSYPQGVSAQSTVSHQVELYNTIDNGLRLVDQLDGWGATNRELTPQSNGITWQWASHWNAANIVGAANDGIGWGIYSGDLSHTNHVQAGIAAQQESGDPLGDWYWAMYVSDGVGSLAKVADFAKTAINFYAPVNFLPGQQGITAQYTTALLDFTVAADNIAIPIPQRGGYIFCPRLLTALIHDGAGTATGSLIWSAGNNAAHNNTAQMTVSAATLNGLIAAAPQPALGNGGGTSALLDSSTQVVVKISTAPTGVSSLHGFFSISGFWVPA